MKKFKLINRYSTLYLLLAIVLGGAIATLPLALKRAIEEISNNGNILMPLLVISGAAMAIVIINIINNFISQKITLTYEVNIKQEILKHYSGQSFKDFSKLNFENNFIYNTQNIVASNMFAKINIFYYFITSSIAIGVIAYLSWIMLPIVILFNVLTVLINIILQKKSSKIKLIYANNRKQYMKHIEDLLTGYKDVAAIGKVKNLDYLFKNYHNSYRTENKKIIRPESAIKGVIRFLSISVSIGIWTSLTLLTNNGLLSVATFIVFVGLNTNFNGQINGFISNIYSVASTKGLVDKIFVNIDKEKAIKISNPFPIKTYSLKFKSRKILKYKDIKIETGDKVRITGPNGSGKSILLKSILRLNKSEGKVLFNSSALNAWSVSNFSKYLSSNTNILDLSVKENILLSFEGNIDKVFIEKYKNLFNALPKLDTNTKNLSHGQKQIVCLLRALYTKPKLMIIDEGLSGLAKELLTKVEKLISELACAIIYVSHQEKTNFNSNKIIRL